MKTSTKNMVFYSKRILLGILAIILTACNIDFQIPANQEIHIAFPQSGHAAEKLQIAKIKQLIVTVNSWLSTHQNNWEIGLVTRPHGLYFEGGNFYLNVLNNEVCLKYCKHRRQCQLYIRKDNNLYYQLQNILNLASDATSIDTRNGDAHYGTEDILGSHRCYLADLTGRRTAFPI